MNKRGLFRLQLSVLLIAFTATLLSAQLATSHVPQRFAETLRSSFQAKKVAISPPAEKRIAQALALQEETSVFRTLTVGIPIETALTPENSGSLRYEEDGSITWQLYLEVAGASSLQLFFDRFNLPLGGKLFILSPEGKLLKGAYTELNNTSLEALAIAPIRGDKLLLHYEGPSGYTRLPELSLKSVGYSFWEMPGFQYLHPGMGQYNRGEPWFMGDYSCSPNVVAKPEWTSQAHSQVLMIVRGSVVCSGSLINNTNQDGTAYILTASHCLNRNFKEKGNMAYIRESARQTVFFFNFRSPLAEQLVRGCEEQSLSGAEVVAYDEETDMCLLRIVGVDPNPRYQKSGGIPASFLPYFSGWNAEEAPQGGYTNLHHPTASTTRYNYCDTASLELIDLAVPTMTWQGVHLQIPRWHVGTTAGGSSGSPLYDREGLVIGALSGGQSTCDRPVRDYFYSINKAFDLKEGLPEEKRLAPWLAPQSKATKLSGYAPYAPLSPKRLSYNLYSPLREDVQTVAPEVLPQLRGIANSYLMPVESQLLALALVVNLENTTKESLPNIVVWAVDSVGRKRELLATSMQLPHYRTHTYEGKGETIRTLKGWIETIIPLDKHDITLQAGEVLYIGLETSSDGAFPFSILRGADNRLNRVFSLLKTDTSGENWLRGDDKVLPKELQVGGNFWIDPIVLPLSEAPHQTPPIDYCLPRGNILNGKLYVYRSEACISLCSITLYSLKGEQLGRFYSHSEIANFDLPQRVLNERTIVVTFSFGTNQRYSTLLITNP